MGYVPVPGGGNAIYNASGIIQYNHSDWLGSARLRTTPSQTLSGDTAFAPYGETYAPTGSSWIQFTENGNQIAATGVQDFFYRHYHPVQGRWLSPDPAGLAAVDPSNPQTWNRYAYVANSPLNATDPLGLDEGCEDGWGIPTDPFCLCEEDPFFWCCRRSSNFPGP